MDPSRKPPQNARPDADVPRVGEVAISVCLTVWRKQPHPHESSTAFLASYGYALPRFSGILLDPRKHRSVKAKIVCPITTHPIS